jgi:partner of Y14 and mago
MSSHPVSSAGIVVDAVTGERHVPSSTRADGSQRREIRIRPGYRPPEDVEVYKNRTAEAWKNRGSGGVPGAENLEDGNATIKSGALTGGKNAKRREARRRAKEAASDNRTATKDFEIRDAEEEVDSGQNQQASIDNLNRDGRKCASVQSSSLVDNLEAERKARNLKKKLRQARELRDKKDKGESLLPEQIEKVVKINDLIRQLGTLGLDGKEGSIAEERKGPAPEKAV